jgi:hypothetical protein
MSKPSHKHSQVMADGIIATGLDECSFSDSIDRFVFWGIPFRSILENA